MKISKTKLKEKGGKLVFKDGAKQILLVENQGEFYAIDNRCPHEGYPLSEGGVDGEKNQLTCNWHNWKFDLKSGRCLIGADHVRTYPVSVESDSLFVDTTDPTPEQIQAQILEGLQTGFEKRQYGRIARELARLDYSGLDPLEAVKKSIEWSYQKFEYGMTHAYAALADWLSLYQKNRDEFSKNKNEQARELSLLCLTEGIEHLAFDSLRHPDYPFNSQKRSFKTEHFLAAIESEDEEGAISMVNGAFEKGMRFRDLQASFSKAALNHYNDFGHSLIYVYKANQLAEFFDDSKIDFYLSLTLARSLAYTTREDLLPEFKAYAPALKKLQSVDLGTQGRLSEEDFKAYEGVRVAGACELVAEQAKKYTPRAIYEALVFWNADNMLKYDLAFQEKTHNPVTQNVGWLDFTHALTFSNACRAVCEKQPELWSKALLQMACFYGRNTPYLDKNVELDDWRVEDKDSFEHEVEQKIYDHGLSAPIFSAHIIKTSLAVFEERDKGISTSSLEQLYASLNRFLNSPLKAKHARRLVHQGVALVKKDFAPSS